MLLIDAEALVCGCTCAVFDLMARGYANRVMCS